VTILAWALLACAHKAVVAPPPRADELDAILARATSRVLPAPGLKATFHIDVRFEDDGGSTIGALVLHPPDDLRVEIQTPFHTPLLIAATDGKALHAYLAKGNVFLRGDDAVAALAAFAGGAIGPADLIDLLAGIPPLDATTLVSKEPIPGGVRAKYDGPAGTSIRIDVDAETAALRTFEVDRSDAQIFVASYGEPFKGTPYPRSLEVKSPVLGLGLEFQHWEQLGAAPDVFSLQPPPNSTERDLLEVLAELNAPQ
jgi:outer membrane lipoprotein-sorting protein